MFRTAILASTLSLLLASGSAWALGLGSIHTQSALNQPFAAEIDLVGANPDELDAVKVVLASEAEFAKRGTDRQHSLTKLRFKPQISPRGRPVVRVTSTDPVREPYMDFLVEVVWPQGRLIREFTVLLDPPVSSRRTMPAVERPVATGGAAPSVEAAAPAAPAALRREPVRSPAPPAVAPPTGRSQVAVPIAGPKPAGGSFPLRSAPVKPGAGLWRMARNMAPPGATVAQTAMALYRNNQNAFVQGDINRMRQGLVLQVPTSAELFALDAAKAEAEFRAAVAGKPVTAKPLTDALASAPEDGSRLKIAGYARPREGGGPGREAGPSVQGVQPNGDIEQELLLVRETGESTRQETDELRARVRQLEASLMDIRDLLTLRNAELDRLRGSSETRMAASVPGGAVPSPSSAGLTTRAAEGQSVVGGAMEGSVVAPASPGSTEVTPMPAAPLVATEAWSGGSRAPAPQGELSLTPGTELAAVAGADQGPGVRAEPGARVEAPDSLVKPAAPVPQAGVPQTEPSAPALVDLPLLDSILAYVPTPVLWSGLVAAPMLGLLTWLAVQRRRRIDASLSESRPPSALNPDGVGIPPMPPMAGVPDSDKGQVVEGQGLTEDRSGVVNLPAPDDEADAVAEADIYIAYGRYRDAQGLLKQAIARLPHSVQLHYKLAETLGSAEDYGALASLLGDMQAEGMDQAHPDQWSRLVELAAAGSGPGPQPTGVDLRPSLGGTEAASGQVAPFLSGAVPAGDRARGAWGFADAMGPGVSGPLSEGDGRAPTASDGLLGDRSYTEELDLDFEGLDFGPGSAPDIPGGLGITPAEGIRNGDADLELTMADLVQATDLDLATLGVAPSVAGMSSQARPAKGPEAEMGPFELGPIEPGTGASDLVPLPWEMDGGLWGDVGTKLDLGRAYVEMNDPEAAQAILAEVIEEGDADQQAEARRLLTQLTGL
jgi:pilus assembly protein FimV